MIKNLFKLDIEGTKEGFYINDVVKAKFVFTIRELGISLEWAKEKFLGTNLSKLVKRFLEKYKFRGLFIYY